jgi:hypothetical protein
VDDRTRPPTEAAKKKSPERAWVTRSGTPTPAWSKQDLLFLRDSLQRGRSFAEIAGFLRRDENDVREKAKELELTDERPKAPDET